LVNLVGKGNFELIRVHASGAKSVGKAIRQTSNGRQCFGQVLVLSTTGITKGGELPFQSRGAYFVLFSLLSAREFGRWGTSFEESENGITGALVGQCQI